MQTKKWYQSKTIWGIVIAALGYLMTIIGVDNPSLPENADFEQLKAYAEAIKAAKGNWSAIVGESLAVVGTIVSIVGRFQADSKVTV